MASSRNNIKNDRLEEAKERGRENTWDFNCWGATLYVLGVRDFLNWEYSANMEEFLNTKTEIVPSDRRKIGDILALWTGRGIEHTAVYLGWGRFFHKVGSMRSEITSMDGILNEYGDSDTIEYRRML